MKKLLSIVLGLVSLMACTSQQKAEENEAQKVLVIYYSQTGATKSVAEELQKQLDADIEAIEVENDYTGDFQSTIERCQKEMQSDEVPSLKPVKADISSYDVIFIGYPVWFGTYARPIASLVKACDFAGKKVVTFCTFGSGGLQESTADLAKALPDAEVVEGYGVRNARVSAIADELNRFLIEGGYKEGEIEALPAFMEQKPVTEAEVEIFNAACGDYQFPLGTPLTVAVRETSSSTDYEYSVSSKGEGGEADATIYVTVGKEADAKPEFTQVIRSKK